MQGVGLHPGGGSASRGGLTPGGRSASRRVCLQGGLHLGGWADPPWILRDTVNERAVRILLQCILVFNKFEILTLHEVSVSPRY